jgi:PAS domain S-box-containing protein
MKFFVPDIDQPFKVRGTEIRPDDTPQQYLQKLARITLDEMFQLVGVLTTDGILLECNRAALDGGGLTRNDVIGKPFWETFWWTVTPKTQADLRDAIRRAAQGESIRYDVEVYARKSGKEVMVMDFTLLPVRDDEGRVVLLLPEGRDITEKKAHEREIARQREELAKLDELKTQFFANISHEFRTPLTLMLGPIEDALADLEEPLGPRQRERATTVQRNGLRLQKLVNALLDFSRVEAGRIQAVYQPTDLASLTHDLASSFRSACDKAGLDLTIETQPLAEPVFVDQEMWEKIVLNLVSNAFKFTLDGGIRVDVCADGDHAVLRVSDTGAGIPEAEVPLIFDRFHRVAGARGRTHEGTGIGLALVQELVKLHKGSVTVESTPGQGTTFIVRVPFGSAHLPQDRIEGVRSQVSTATRAEAFVSEALRWLSDGVVAEGLSRRDEPLPLASGLRGERARVVLADDNADMREYLCRLLASKYDVTAVADGEEALAAARRLHPDLVLTDVMMPRLDGFELLQQLRADPELRDVPVIVLSARAGEEAKVEGLRMGADDYLVKPFSARELLARVGSDIELARTRSESARILREEGQVLELLNKVGTAVAAELDLESAAQVVTDAATELSGAAFGAFFYNVIDEKGETCTLHAVSGVARAAFAKFPMPRDIEVLGPTFRAEGIVRSADIANDPRYGWNEPYLGMLEGHLPVRSCLAAPVISRSGEVLGRLILGHPEVGVFSERAERIVAAIAVQAGIAIDKARLYRAAQDEIERRKRVETALRESEETLEAKVAERTAQLADINAQLIAEAEEREKAERRAEDERKQLDELEGILHQRQRMATLGEMAASIAHEINQPLTAIVTSGNAGLRWLGKETTELGEVRNALERIVNDGKRAGQIVAGIRTMLKGKGPEKAWLEINELVREVLGLARDATRNHHIIVETELMPQLPPVLGDRVQLQQVMLNLIMNAIEAMAGVTGRPRSLRVKSEADDSRGVLLTVEDSGTGIGSNDMSRIFDPLFTTKPNGMGMGLAICRSIIEAHGGRLWASLGTHHGSIFHVTLPIGTPGNE